MLRRLLLPASLAVVAFALAACPKPVQYPNCKSDEQCKEHNEVCVDGQCKECGRDGDCKTGFVCKENRCTPKPECAADQDCQAGFKCKGQKCQPECAANSDCGSGMQCKAGRCAPATDCVSDADCGSGRRCDGSKCVDASSLSSACSLETVYFGYNEYTLTGEAQRTLDKIAECLKARKGTAVVTLAGHADERGTEEYNLHLGERRANAAKRYLNALGVEGARLKTISYGKERPAVNGHDEAAWSKNRRVEFAD